MIAVSMLTQLEMNMFFSSRESKLWYIHRELSWNKIIKTLHATKWMNLTNIILKKRNYTKKSIWYVISLTKAFQKLIVSGYINHQGVISFMGEELRTGSGLSIEDSKWEYDCLVLWNRTFIWQFLHHYSIMYQFSSVQSLSRVWVFVTPWIVAHEASLSINNSRSSLKLTSIDSVMPSSHLILCRPLLLLPRIPPSITLFSNESTLRMRWPKYWSFSFSIIPSKEHPGLIFFRMDWLDLLAVQGTLKSLLQHHSSNQFFGTQLSSQSNSHIHTWPLEKP